MLTFCLYLGAVGTSETGSQLHLCICMRLRAASLHSNEEMSLFFFSHQLRMAPMESLAAQNTPSALLLNGKCAGKKELQQLMRVRDGDGQRELMRVENMPFSCRELLRSGQPRNGWRPSVSAFASPAPQWLSMVAKNWLFRSF